MPESWITKAKQDIRVTGPTASQRAKTGPSQREIEDLLASGVPPETLGIDVSKQPISSWAIPYTQSPIVPTTQTTDPVQDLLDTLLGVPEPPPGDEENENTDPTKIPSWAANLPPGKKAEFDRTNFIWGIVDDPGMTEYQRETLRLQRERDAKAAQDLLDELARKEAALIELTAKEKADKEHAEALLKQRQAEQLAQQQADEAARAQQQQQFQAQQAYQQQQFGLQQQQFGWQQEQAREAAATQQQNYLAQLASQPISWLQHAGASGEQPVVQPWMIPLMGQQYAGTVAGAPLPGFQQGQEGATPSMSQLPQLTTPSQQYWARSTPTAQQQYLGYEQARTGARPEDVLWRLGQAAPPSGMNPQLRTVK